MSQRASSRRETTGPNLTWLLIALVVLLAVAPLAFHPGSEFAGADSLATTVITEINPDAQPWFEPLWSPPGAETESLLFALQAALGAAAIGYFFGLKKGEKRSARSEG